MINLDEKLLVGKGGRREVYLDPRDTGGKKCIKVTPIQNKLVAKAVNKHWYKKFRSLEYFDENNTEIKAYRHIKNEKVYENLPRFYGIVETNLGRGIVVDYIDKITLLKDFIENYGVTDNLLKALKKMFQNFISNGVEIRDYTLLNYAVKIVDGELRVYMIDGLGNANLIPLNRWIPYFGRKQTIRRIKRMLSNFIKIFPKYEKEFRSLLNDFSIDL